MSEASKKLKEFVEVWQSSDNADEVAEKLKLSSGSVRGTASQLRKKGVPLKYMRRGLRGNVDYGELAELARKLDPNADEGSTNE